MEYKYVSFDIADQSFSFYTAMDWHNLIAEAKEELVRGFGEESHRPHRQSPHLYAK